MSIELIIDAKTTKYIEINERPILLGRSKDCDVILQSDYTSTKHCICYLDKGQATIKDLDSTNGIFLNDKRIKTSKIYIDDIMSVGRIRMFLNPKKMDLREVLIHTKDETSVGIEILEPTQIEESEESVKESEESVKESEESVKESEEPVKESEESVKESEEPVKESEEPVKESEKPVKESEKSVKESEKELEKNNKSYSQNEISDVVTDGRIQSEKVKIIDIVNETDNFRINASNDVKKNVSNNKKNRDDKQVIPDESSLILMDNISFVRSEDELTKKVDRKNKQSKFELVDVKINKKRANQRIKDILTNTSINIKEKLMNKISKFIKPKDEEKGKEKGKDEDEK